MKTAVWWLALGLLWPQEPSTALAESFDLSKSSVPREEILSGGPPKDGIPALTDPKVVSAEAAIYLRTDDRVLGVVIDNQARAYPIRILNWHEVVNDQLSSTPIVVTYCPLCGTGIVFRASRNGQRTLFGVSGLLYNSDVLLYDKDTESLWSQLKMEAIAGARMGERLEWLPSEHTTWAAWRKAHPQTEVLSLDTGYTRDYGRDPYASYETSRQIWFPVNRTDNRLHPKTWIAGVLVNGQAKAYPLEHLRDGATLHDVIGNQEVHVSYDASARSVKVANASGRLIPSVQAYWFAWAAFYPETLVYHEAR